MGFEKAIPHKWVIFFSFWIPFNIHVENTRIVTLGQIPVLDSDLPNKKTG